jgi:acyl-CoA dehydrogenase
MDDLKILCNRVKLRILLEVVGSGDAQYASAAENPNTPPTEGNPMAIDLQATWSDTDIQAWRETVVRFVEDEVASADALARQNGHLNPAFWRRAGELGMLCTDIPESMGGIGGDFRHEVVLQEEMARRGLLSLNTGVHSIAAHYLMNHGTPDQQAHFLPRMVSGELVGAIAMTEPGAGSDLQSIRTRAKLDGNEWVLNGSKTFISNGLLAGLVMVVAKTDPQAGAKGISIFIVETAQTKGFRVGRLIDKIGLKGQDTTELFFEDMRLPRSALLGGQEGRGFAQLMGDLPYERTIIGVISVAAMEGALAATVAYARERKVFGQALIDLQNTKFKLAEIATLVKVGRTFIDRCITQVNDGTLDTTTASMAKLWCSETQARVIDECLQLFGGYGYTNDYMIGRMYTDARIQRIYGGSNEIMKEVISRAL